MDLYYESAGAIITLILFGKLLEAKTKGQTSSAIKKLIGLQPKKAKIIENGVEKEVLIENLKVGDIVPVNSEKGKIIIGICGGLQMLGKKIYDPKHLESDILETEGFNFFDYKMDQHQL